MPKLALLALLVPSIAAADDVHVTVSPVITVAPAPAATPPPPPSAAAPEEDPCAATQHHRWRSRMKGRLALGFAKSHLELADDREGTQKSLVGRIGFRRGVAVELELARAAIGDDTAKTFGGALVKSFGRRRLAPYVIAGGGGGRLELADGTESRVRYGEVGAGLLLKGRRLAIGVDFRRGVRKVDDGAIELSRMTVPDEATDRERYTRGRVLALVQF